MKFQYRSFLIVLLVAVLSGCETLGGKGGGADVAVEDRGTGADSGAVATGAAAGSGISGYALDDPNSPLSRRVIYFEFDSDRIKEESYELLRDIAAVIADSPNLKYVVVEGHTDSVGTEAYNLTLSRRRVESVREFLINLGIKPKTLLVKAYGEAYPIATNETDEGRSKNRRVEFRAVMEFENVKKVLQEVPVGLEHLKPKE